MNSSVLLLRIFNHMQVTLKMVYMAWPFMHNVEKL